MAGLRVPWMSAAGILAYMGAPPIPSEGPEPDVLAGFVVQLVAVVASAPMGGPHPYPARCSDITYIPVSRGFLYLVVIMDWASRYVLAWRL